MIRHRIVLLGALVLLAPMPAHAQNRAAGWVTISAPEQWSDGRTLSVTPGRRISIAGQAFHRGGIDSIIVNGRAAAVKRGSNNVADFTASITAARGMREVMVLVKPRSGSAVRKTFAIAVTGPAPMAAAPQRARAESRMTADGAFKRGLLVPGLGQIATDRKPLGAAIMVAGVGALGYGIFSTREEPDLTTTRPHLALGIGTYVVLAVAGAFEAKSYVKKHPTRFGYGPVEVLRYATVMDDAIVFELVRVSF